MWRINLRNSSTTRLTLQLQKRSNNILQVLAKSQRKDTTHFGAGHAATQRFDTFCNDTFCNGSLYRFFTPNLSYKPGVSPRIQIFPSSCTFSTTNTLPSKLGRKHALYLNGTGRNSTRLMLSLNSEAKILYTRALLVRPVTFFLVSPIHIARYS